METMETRLGPLFEVSCEYLFSLNKDCYVYQPVIYRDPINDEEYVQKVLVVAGETKELEFAVPPCLAAENFKNFLQSLKPTARVRQITEAEQGRIGTTFSNFFYFHDLSK